ncbi:hypothetical protein BGZ65_003147 [Modicella reniformis]|uniref:Uncharacterized protein n=1 Tax=Modicella reniformis TaxID=1440133 RepID=A0A9P6INH0_9FUNG|nr:hypothetical protein BGZ65_003147 [Modicella reniformis]
MKLAAKMLAHCGKLKDVSFLNINRETSSMTELLKEYLENLIITGYRTSFAFVIGITPTTDSGSFARRQNWKPSANVSDRARRPRKFRHHEYRDDGQGWFLRLGLDNDSFDKAIEDGEWKRKLFEHMYTTSGIKNAKYVRLNDTEFFALE